MRPPRSSATTSSSRRSTRWGTSWRPSRSAGSPSLRGACRSPQWPPAVGRVTSMYVKDNTRLRFSRGLSAARLAARGGARYAASAPRLFATAGEQRQRLRNDLALRTAEDVADTLGTMKGVLMKIGQLASYVDDGLNPQARRTLSRLQDGVP